MASVILEVRLSVSKKSYKLNIIRNEIVKELLKKTNFFSGIGECFNIVHKQIAQKKASGRAMILYQ